MSKSFSLDQLTEGIRRRNLGSQNRQLVEKWSRTGLLRGLNGVHRENMARMLENQAGQVLKEASSVSTGGANLAASGDLRGFTNIAFPIVRRVFGGLIANELVSIQPMSLPSGLLFYLDYTYGGALAGNAGSTALYPSGNSIYNDPAGKGVRSGSLAVGGQYDLAGTGFTRVYKVITSTTQLASGSYRGSTYTTITNNYCLQATGSDGKLIQFDPQLVNAIENNSATAASMKGGNVAGNAAYSAVVLSLNAADGASGFNDVDTTLVKSIGVKVANPIKEVGNDTNGNRIQGATGCGNVLRLNQIGTYTGGTFTADALISPGSANAALLLIVSGGAGTDGAHTAVDLSAPLGAGLDSASGNADTLTIPAFESNFATDPSPTIPEIDIKIEAVAVVANTRK